MNCGLQEGTSALYLAALGGHKEVVSLLLGRGAKVDKAAKVGVMVT
jgi:ankyrin repeat protein